MRDRNPASVAVRPPAQGGRGGLKLADSHHSFVEMVEILSRSSLPLSIRSDMDTDPSEDEVKTAQAVISHVMTDTDVRSRLASMKVEPLVRASAVLLADMRRRTGDTRSIASGIVEFLDVLAGAYGPVPSLLNNRGLARLEAGDAHRAITDFDAARRLAPAFMAPRVNGLEAYRALSDLHRVEVTCDEILRIDRKNLAALRARLDARTEARRSNPDVLEAAKALYDAGGATELDLLLLGSLSMKLDDPAAAVQYFEEYVAIEPDSVEGHRFLGGSYLNSGDFEAAVRSYERVLELDGPKAEHLLALGAIYDHLDRVGDALRSYERALEVATDEERDAVAETLDEFKERRASKAQTAPAAPARVVPPGPLAEEEDLVAEEPEGTGGAAIDLSGEAFEPKVIGDVDLAGIVEEEIELLEAAARGPPEPAAAPSGSAEPETTAKPEAVDGGEPAVEQPPSDAEPPADGEPPAKDETPVEAPAEPPAPVPAVPEPEEAGSDVEVPTDASEPEGTAGDEPPEPEAPQPDGPAEDEPHRPTDSEELAAALEAAASGWEGEEEEVEEEEHAPAPELPAPTRRPSGDLRAVVSAPPPPKEPAPPLEDDEPSEELARELDRVSGALAQGEEVTDEGETFRRPGFDVDEFMKDLDAKTAATFEHLYDGMLEARRREAAAGVAPEEPPTTPYVSAPPIEGLQGMAVGQAPAPAGEAPTADDRTFEPAHSFAPYAEGAAAPPIPLLLKAQAEREATRPRAPPAPRAQLREAVPERTTPAAPPMDGEMDRARALAEAGDDGEALRMVDAYLASYPDDAGAWNLRGDLRERAAAEEDALQCYRNAVKYDPNLKEAWNNLGVLLHLLGRFDDAAEALESGTRVDPKDRHLWHNLGSTYHELGRPKDAIKAFDRAVGVDPHDKVSHNNKGTTLFEMGDFAGARAAFQRAIEVDPEFEQAQNNLGRALEKLGYLDDAAEAYRRALKLNPRSRAASANLARLDRGARGAKS